MSSFLSEPLRNPPPPPYVENGEEVAAEECTAAPLPTIAKLAPIHDPVKEFAIEIWKDIAMKTHEKLHFNFGKKSRHFNGSGKRQPSPVECPALVADWARFKRELMQGLECNWVDEGSASSGSRWFVQYRFLSDVEYRGPPTNVIANCYWVSIKEYKKSIELAEEEERRHQSEARESAWRKRAIVGSIKNLLQVSAKAKKAQTLILLTNEQAAMLPEELKWIIIYEDGVDVSRCTGVWLLDPATFQRNRESYDKLKKEHLQDIGNPEVLVGDWYVVDWKIPPSCCTIC
jgi:hypothetical protein